jgi:hypothetical protein
VHLAKCDQPYYLDASIILKSDQKLSADPTAEIRLKPGSNTCMVRNEHIVGFPETSNSMTSPTSKPAETTTSASFPLSNNLLSVGNIMVSHREGIQAISRWSRSAPPDSMRIR